MIPMAAAEDDFELRTLLDSEENLVTLCEECNLGKSDIAPRLRELAILLIRLRKGSLEKKATGTR
jgi:5-methylcytosine-specific restriction endonuclease McrA